MLYRWNQRLSLALLYALATSRNGVVRPVRATAVDNVISKDEMTEQTGNDPTAKHSSFQCGLWMAPSTIPNAGLGMFNGYRPLASPERDAENALKEQLGKLFQEGEQQPEKESDDFGAARVDYNQVALPAAEVEFHNGYFKEKYNDQMEKTELKAMNWRHYWMNFVINPGDFGLRDDEDLGQDTHMFVPGAGALCCCHFAVNNVDEPRNILVDTMNLHRSKDPGVGAFSSYHGYNAPTIQEIPPFHEIFGSYGHEWFEDRAEVIGFRVPFEEDFDDAQVFLDDIKAFMHEHGSALTKHPEDNVPAEIYKLLTTYYDDEDSFDEALVDFASRYAADDQEVDKTDGGDSKDSEDFKHNQIIHGQIEADLVILVRKSVEDLNEPVFRALPPNWTEAIKVMQLPGGITEYEAQKSTRSREWFEENGRCADQILPGNSKIPQAGRGAFAQRHFQTGEIVAHAPILHVSDRSLFDMYGPILDEDGYPSGTKPERNISNPIGKQILLNYCFGRNPEESSVLLCPYGSSTSYINHDEKNFNVMIQWASSVSWFDESCLSLTPDELAEQMSTCLAFDYVAVRNIAEGEEILLNYGSEWQQAWDDHITNWVPVKDDDNGKRYIRAHDLNLLYKNASMPIRTLEEEDEDPYSSNNLVECRNSEISTWFPCDVVERKMVESASTVRYKYTVEIRVDDIEDAPTSKGAQFKESLEEGGDVYILTDIAQRFIRFVDERYSTDEYLPNAFRHHIQLPEEMFPQQWVGATTSDTMLSSLKAETPQDALSSKTEPDVEPPLTDSCQAGGEIGECKAMLDFDSQILQPGEIRRVKWSTSGKAVNEYCARIGLDPNFTKTMLDYADRIGVTEMYWNLLQKKEPFQPGEHRFYSMDNDRQRYYVNRPESKWRSNMHWAGPADEFAHEEYLKVLGKAGFDQVLRAMGDFFELDGLFIQGVGFIGVSHCDKGYIHNDMTETGGKFFNVLIPLVLIDGATPELILQDDHSGEEGFAKYRLNEAIVVGDDAYHGTAACDYSIDNPDGLDAGIRMGISVYIADLNEDNMEAIISDTTTIFPIPHDEDWAIAQKGRHWGQGKSLANDQGRRSFDVQDKWQNCASLANQGSCDTDIWDMRPNCVKTCKVYVEEP